jgi:hypothetical protein
MGETVWLRVCDSKEGQPVSLLADCVPDCAVAPQSALVHSCQHRDPVVDVIIDLNEALVVVETMEAASILLAVSPSRR